MSFEPDYIVTTFTLAFGLACLGSGLFTAYFGAGKSRTIGVVLTGVGAASLFAYYWLGWGGGPYNSDLVLDGFMAGLGAIVGAGVAVAVILVVLMKVDTTEDLEDLDLDDLEDLDLDEELKKLEAELEAEEEAEGEETEAAEDAEPVEGEAAEEAEETVEAEAPEPETEPVPEAEEELAEEPAEEPPAEDADKKKEEA